MELILTFAQQQFLIELMLDTVDELTILSEEEPWYVTDLVDRAKTGLEILNHKPTDVE